MGVKNIGFFDGFGAVFEAKAVKNAVFLMF